mmetsp:Transcript_67751/g.133257  ORF Transcript_67751/g.133257 Transcript_67751/m.133257 type:complete len:241 (+) Transcript_67751:27-749(+)
MPPKKKTTKKKTARLSEEDDIRIDQIDVQYNPDIVTSLIAELGTSLEAKCSQIQQDSDFLVTSIQQDFQIELIKLPKDLKYMSIKRFKEEYGYSLEAFTRGAIGGGQLLSKANSRSDHSFGGARSANSRVMQTPASSKYSSMSTPRMPREGEQLLSENGSPLGEFQTVKKAARPDGNSIVPPTPGMYVPLKGGAVVDIAELDQSEIENLAPAERAETLNKLEETMNNMQALMAKLRVPQP